MSSGGDTAGTCKGKSTINLQVWAMAETGVSVYPEMRIYHTMQRKLEDRYTAAGLSFIILDR